MPRRVVVLLPALTCLAIAACSSPASPSAPPSNDADAAFVLHMLPHHQRALQVGQLAAERGSDPRVRDFGQRILREQTPEAAELTGWVSTLGLTTTAGDAGMADGYVDDAAYARLQAESGPAFDRDVLLASASSETGAAAMAARELAGGSYDPARQLAQAISTAPGGEIPELQALAATLPS